MKTEYLQDFKNLNKAEKILLVEDLWDSIAEDDSDIPVPGSHIKELEARLEKQAMAPGKLLTLEELSEKIERRK